MNPSKCLKGTLTEANIVAAYMSESAAYTRYNFYAKQAENEKYFPVAQIFTEAAENELHHGKVFFKFLEGGSVPCNIDVDAGIIGNTATNLTIAAHEELVEGIEQYTKAAKIAIEEGFTKIAENFRAIAEVESIHRERFERYLKHINNNTVWSRDKPVKWQCLVCGYIHTGTEPPKICSACDHPYQHYMAIE
jgi:rubrerythrin